MARRREKVRPRCVGGGKAGKQSATSIMPDGEDHSIVPALAHWCVHWGGCWVMRGHVHVHVHVHVGILHAGGQRERRTRMLHMFMSC